MSTDDEAARKARAERLRREIKRVQYPAPTKGAAEEEAATPRAKSPRELIEEKMRELNDKESK
jgi:hypothetical protein